jgi:hypothetical protein
MYMYMCPFLPQFPKKRVEFFLVVVIKALVGREKALITDLLLLLLRTKKLLIKILAVCISNYLEYPLYT